METSAKGGRSGMRRAALRAWRVLAGALAAAGAVAAVLAGLQFTQVPWKVYSYLSEDGAGGGGEEGGREPTHIVVFGGSGVPGESGLMRLWYTADAAAKHPGAAVWMALPCGAGGKDDPAAAAYEAELRLRGVGAGRCEVRGCGENTRSQAVSLVRELKGESGGGAEVPCVLVVTSPEHVRRACLAVRRAARDAGVVVEVRGLAAANLSLEDHGGGGGGEREEAVEVPKADSGATAPLAFRYDFWNHAAYSLDSARECVALLYYRVKGWI